MDYGWSGQKGKERKTWPRKWVTHEEGVQITLRWKATVSWVFAAWLVLDKMEMKES